MSDLEAWIAGQARFATAAMLRAISATDLTMERPGFGQRIIPRPGSVLASPVCAHYDPDPDYFFHWFRDSAIVIDALRVAFAAGFIATSAIDRLREFVQFSLALRALDGPAFLRAVNPAARVQPDFRKYLRPEEEIAALSGDAVLADVRVNADGTPDVARWARPQADGPALRALTLMRWESQLPSAETSLRTSLQTLIRGDLDFTLAYADRPCVDIWEESCGQHYYTQLVQAEALRCGAAWLTHAGQETEAHTCRATAQQLFARLDRLWSEPAGCYRASADGRELDIAVILGVLHAGRTHGAHCVLDPRTHATLGALEQLFAAAYPINRNRPPERAPAMGRYAHDRYYSGGAYFFATLAAAEFHFALACALRAGGRLAVTAENRRFLHGLGVAGIPDAGVVAALALERGDAFLRTVRAFTPLGGELAEQFDQSTGAPSSARQLSWSYAAFVSAAVRRAEARPPTTAAAPPAPPADRA
jgi:glucoamylase